MHNAPKLHALLGSVVKAITRTDAVAALKLLNENKRVLQSNSEEVSNFRASVLYHAIQCSCTGLIAFTLNLAPAPDINFYRLYGYTPISLAIEKNSKQALPLLYAKSDKTFALHAAVKSKQKQTVAALLGQFHFSHRILAHLGLERQTAS